MAAARNAKTKYSCILIAYINEGEWFSGCPGVAMGVALDFFLPIMYSIAFLYGPQVMTSLVKDYVDANSISTKNFGYAF